MKKLFLLIFALVSLSFAAGGNYLSADSASFSVRWYEMSHIDSSQYKGILFGSLTSGLDTLDGADSVQILRKFVPKTNLFSDYILKVNALSGDSAANTVATLILDALDKNDSVMSTTTIDTLAAAGTTILIPFTTSAGGIGTKFNAYIKSGNASDETVIQKLWLYTRRPRSIQTIK